MVSFKKLLIFTLIWTLLSFHEFKEIFTWKINSIEIALLLHSSPHLTLPPLTWAALCNSLSCLHVLQWYQTLFFFSPSFPFSLCLPLYELPDTLPKFISLRWLLFAVAWAFGWCLQSFTAALASAFSSSPLWQLSLSSSQLPSMCASLKSQVSPWIGARNIW